MASGDGLHHASLVVDGREIAFTVRRHPRARRLTLRLSAAGDAVVVTIPPVASVADGIALAHGNLDWIAARLCSRPAPVPFEDGRAIPLRGVEHRIHHSRGVMGIFAEDGTIHIGGAVARVAPRLLAWLREQAQLDLTAAVAALTTRLDQLPHGPVGRISVRDTCSRWGSCAANGNLSFSWRLILAPPPVLRYVVAHELAHLSERNHGPRFWAAVDTIAGNVDAPRAWLRRHGPGLHRYR